LYFAAYRQFNLLIIPLKIKPCTNKKTGSEEPVFTGGDDDN